MAEDLDALVRQALQVAEDPASVPLIVDLVLEKSSEARERPFNLATALRRQLNVDIRDLHMINGWLRGELTREQVEEHFRAR